MNSDARNSTIARSEAVSPSALTRSDEATRFGGRHAVVVGGSMAGLVAARVLADHFDQVTLIERDTLGDAAQPRKGVPQGRHAHLLLKRGEEILETLFPGIVAAMINGGAIAFDMGTELRWFHFGVWKRHFEDGIQTLSLSRPYLEMHVRRRLFEVANVRRLDGYDATGLLADRGGAVISGVRVRRREAEAVDETLVADLVVDATGRGSPMLKWLEAMGHAPPAVSEVTVHVGYASRIYRRPAKRPDWKVLYAIGKPPDGKRFGAVLPVEGDRWVVTLGGFLKEHASDEESDFLAFARALPVPDVYDAIRDAEPISDIAIHKFPSNRRNHFERLPRRLEGVAFVGDSLCSFNPIYAQGMTTGAMTAMELGNSLIEQRRRCGRGTIAGFTERFQRRVARVIAVPWILTTGEDYRYPQVAGARPLGFSLLQWYIGRVHAASARDADVAARFYRAMHMVESPATLFHPRAMAGVIRDGG